MTHENYIIPIYLEVLTGKRFRFPIDTWAGSPEGKLNAQQVLRYLILEKLSWNREDLCQNFNLLLLKEYKLDGALQRAYNNIIFPYVSESFPKWKLNPWELQKSRVPVGFWTEEQTAKATRWLFTEKLKWSNEQISNHVSGTTFQQNNLGGMLQLVFHNNACAAVEHAFPEHEWTYLRERAGYKLTLGQSKTIQFLSQNGSYSQRELAKLFNVSPATITYVLNVKHMNKTNIAQK